MVAEQEEGEADGVERVHGGPASRTCRAMSARRRPARAQSTLLEPVADVDVEREVGDEEDELMCALSSSDQQRTGTIDETVESTRSRGSGRR